MTQQNIAEPREKIVHPLWQQMEQVGSRAQQAVVLYALGRCVLQILIALLIAAAIDYWFRWPSIEARWLLSAGWWSVIAFSLFQATRLIVQARWEPLAIARRIEERFPHLRPQLSTAVDFLRPQRLSRSSSGSPELRRAVVERAWQLTQQENLRSVIDPSAVRPVQWGACGLLLGALGFALLFPSHAPPAVRRVLFPTDDIRWPQKHWLAFEEVPRTMTRGADLHLALMDRRGNLPSEVTLHLRWEGDDRIEVRPMRRQDDQMVASLPKVTRSFEFRAEGGDDHSLPWQAVQVLDPVQIAQSQWTISPPAYLHREPYASATLAPLPIGSQLHWEVTFDEPIRTAVLVDRMNGTSLPGRVVAEQRFEFPAEEQPWQPASSGIWQLDVIDQQGHARQGPDVAITLVPDQQPSIRWQDEREIVAGTRSRLPFELIVADDHAVRQVMLQVWRDDQQLWQQEVFRAEKPTVVSSEQLASLVVGESLVEKILSTQLDLAELPPQAEGSELKLLATVVDFRPEAEAIVSPTRSIRIISAEQLQDKLLEETADFQALVLEAVRSQILAREQAMRISQEPTRPTIDEATFAQQKVLDLLLERDRGLLPRLQHSLERWHSHRLSLPVAAQAWDQVLNSGRELEQRELSEVIAAIQKQQWTQVAALQDSILTRLSEWSQESSAGAEETRLFDELVQLRQEQADVMQRCEELRIAWLEGLAAGEDVAAQEKLRGDQKSYGLAQWELARRIDRVQAAVQTLPDKQELSRAFLAAGIGAQLRGAARDLEQAQWNAATRQQREALAAIDALLKRWRPAESGADSADQTQLQQAAAVITQWQAAHDLAVKTWQEALAGTDVATARQSANQAFSGQMRELSQAIRAAAKNWSSTRLASTKTKLETAAQSFESAAEAAEQQQTRAALAAANQGRAALAAAGQAVTSAAGSAQQEALRARIESALEQLTTLQQDQQQLLSRTIRFQSTRPQEEEPLPRSQLAEIQALATEQSSAADRLVTITTALPLPAFQLVLRLSETQMRAAAKRLVEQQTDRATQQQQRAALLKLQLAQEQLRVALQLPEEIPTEPSDEETSPRESPSGNKNGRSMAELRIVAELQRQITQRHVAFNNVPPQTRKEELANLAQEQQAVAELVAGWSTESAGAQKQLPIPENPGTAELARQMVAQELSGGEDLGEESPTFLVQLAHRLQLAAVLLDNEHTHAAAIPLQQKVVQDLDQVLSQQQLKRQQSSVQRQQTQNDQPGGDDPATGGDPDNKSGTNPTEQSPTKAEFDPREIERLRRTIWGHLPPQVQEQLQRAAEGDFLPQYERQIREYYRRLAEEQRAVP